MRLPAVRPSLVRPILVANLVGEVVIVITGGVVRLTGSGLGCPTWPECVPGSFTPVPYQEEGIHKLIEFGNRTLTGVVGLLALACVWAVFTRMRQRRPLLLVAVGLVAGVLLQAVVGGIAVRMTLSPVVVAFHFLLSMVMIALSTMLLRGSEDGWSPDGTADVAAARAARAAPGRHPGVGDRRGRRGRAGPGDRRHRVRAALRRRRAAGPAPGSTRGRWRGCTPTSSCSSSGWSSPCSSPCG